ncbi:MAG: hypothetical protein WC794_03990 [Candidatus Doudnabacteria bacterium]
MKIRINNISSVVVPFRRANPAQILIEIKDNTHPIHLVRGGLCPIGGNWIGQTAIHDASPLDTVRREVFEELVLDSKPVSTEALVELGLAEVVENYATSRNENAITNFERLMLNEVVGVIIDSMSPFGSYLNTITREAMLSVDPSSTRETFTTLSCYFLAPLDDATFFKLSVLQQRVGNLSNESITLVTSLDEILERNLSGAFAHEQPLRDFFLAMGFNHAKHMRIVPNQTSVYAGPPLASYADYLKLYDVAKKPIG